MMLVFALEEVDVSFCTGRGIFKTYSLIVPFPLKVQVYRCSFFFKVFEFSQCVFSAVIAINMIFLCT